MLIESQETMQPPHGIARRWRIGPIVIEWFVERPTHERLRLDCHVALKWLARPRRTVIR